MRVAGCGLRVARVEGRGMRVSVRLAPNTRPPSLNSHHPTIPQAMELDSEENQRDYKTKMRTVQTEIKRVGRKDFYKILGVSKVGRGCD